MNENPVAVPAPRARPGFAAAAALLALALPALGLLWSHRPWAPYLEFPPVTRHLRPAPYEGAVWWALLLLELPLYGALVALLARGGRDRGPPRARFPGWGWAALAGLALAWFVAWTRLPLFAPVQLFTFSPLWLGYIAVVNALTHRRRGDCLLTREPGHLLALFPVSAVFWWYFEYLNRFVQNWHYEGLGPLGPWSYVLFATLPFATVLPAVMSTDELLATIWPDPPRRATPPRPGRVGSALLLALGGAGLFFVGIHPNQLFPLLWIAPLLLGLAALGLQGRPTLLNDPPRRWARLALAALVCGFFWEMWNEHSLARWVYAVPYVQRFEVFEMPILGFAGYLPFGLECALIADWVRRVMGRAEVAP